MGGVVRFSYSTWAAFLVALAGLPGCGNDDPKSPEPSEVTLPDPGPNGWQWTTGLFEVEQGAEVQDCYFFEVPFDHPVFVNRITAIQNDGSHHMNVFRLRTIKALDGNPGDVVKGGECWKSGNWADWPLVANNQSDGKLEDWSMPDGVAMRFEAREKLMLQTHYVNASTQETPADGKVVINFEGIEEAQVQAEMGTLFATNQNIRICPGEQKKTFESTCKIAADGPVKINAANGHFHSRGDRFSMSPWDELAGKGTEFYQSLDWDDPPLVKDLAVDVSQNGGVTWTCEFSAAPDECGDPADDCCFTFGGHVEYQEHCNAFVYYWPRGKTDKTCF